MTPTFIIAVTAKELATLRRVVASVQGDQDEIVGTLRELLDHPLSLDDARTMAAELHELCPSRPSRIHPPGRST